MTTPTSAGDLLSQRPHTTLPADAYDEPDDDDEEDDDYPEWGGGALEDEEDQDQDEEEEPWYKEAAEQYSELLEDADEHQLKLTDYQRYTRRLKESLLNQVYSIWKAAGPTRQTAAQVGQWVQSGQEAQSYLTQMYAERSMGATFNVFHPGPGILERPSAGKTDLYSRAIRERSLGAQLSKLTTLAVTDLQLAKTRTLYSAFDEDQRVNRHPIKTYRRVTESEKPCALCIIASDQVYFTTDLMPIHDNCECDVELADEEDLDEHKARYHHLGWVQSLLDTGDKHDTIKTLADQGADASDYHNLVAIRQHGDLGPVLSWRDQRFTGPGELPVPRPVRPVPTVSGAGPGHEARLQRNAARVAQIRRQRGNLDMRYRPGHGGGSTFVPTSKVARPIPRRVEPPIKLAPVIPIRPKPIDFEHDSVPSIVNAMAAKHPRVGGWSDPNWLNPKYSEVARRRALQAMDECMDRYPNASIDYFSIKNLDDGVLGETGYYAVDNKAVKYVGLSDVMMEAYKGEKALDPNGFHYPSYRDDPVRSTVYHEFGHVIDHQSGRVARQKANSTVVGLYNKSGRMQEVTPEMTAGEANRALLHNEDDMREWMSEGDRISGYSMIDGKKPNQLMSTRLMGPKRYARMGLAAPEAVAEAFSEVEMRGDKASDVAKALHHDLIDAYEHPQELKPAPTPVAAMKAPAVDQLRAATAPKPDWTPAQMHKEDNFVKNKAGQVILNDKHRALAMDLARKIWIAGSRVEPDLTAAAQSSTESLGGFMSGLDFRKKTGPSLYRKIQAEAIEIANGEPVTLQDVREAANGIKDAVRYTAVMPEEGFWSKGGELRKALESLGAKTIKDPVGIPLNGYRGRNMAFTLNGFPFEMQVNTELGIPTKDEAHKIYDVSRKLETDLKAKGIDPQSDPAYMKMMHDMQMKWDTIPITKGTPVVQTEKDAKSGDLNKVLYTTDHTAYYGPTIPGGEVPLDSPEMVGRARVPSTRYGMTWFPDNKEADIVAPARAISDEGWNTLAVQHLPPGTPIIANEGTLKKKSIDKVVGGKEPFREGYIIKLYQDEKGLLHVVDGHTRIAMYNALGKDMPVRIMTHDELENLVAQSDFASAQEQHEAIALVERSAKPPDLPAVTGLSADQKGWGTVAKRISDGKEVKPVYSKTKGGKKSLDVEATWAKVSDETLRENWRKALRAAAPWAQKAGADWYPGVHRLAEKLTSQYGDTFEKRWGVKLTPDLTASFFAAYSENNGWDGNLVGVRRLLDGTGNAYLGKLKDFSYEEASDYKGTREGKYGIKYVIPADEPTPSMLAKIKAGKSVRGAPFQIPGYQGWYRFYDFHVNKCLRAMKNPRGGIADLRENDATAPKPADFGANIAGDYSRATADRWVARIILHTDDGEFAESMRGFTKTKNKVPNRIGYQRMSQALQEVAREPEFAHLNAAAVQAIPWVHVVGPLGSIGEIDDLSSYASVKAETLRKAAEFGDVQ